MSRNNALAKGALLLFSTAAVLLFVEVFARVHLAGPIALIPSYGNSFQAIFLSPIVHKVPGSDLPWELKPNFAGHFKLTTFTSNSRGLRANREYAFEKPAATYRVAVIGDSFTMPSGVSIEDAYHSVLERMLNASAGGHFEFIKFGVGGYSLANYLTVLETKVLAYRPDHVLIGLCIANDIPVVKRPESKPPRRRPSHVLTSRHPFYSYWTLDLVARAIPPSTDRPGKKDDFDLEEFDRLLREFKRLRDQHRFEMTFAVLKISSSQDKERYRVVAQQLEEHDLALVDAGSEFGPRRDLAYTTTRLDRHPDKAAHRKFAEALMKNVPWDLLAGE